MAKLTISEALGWQKTLKERHSELVGLRNENSHSDTRYYGANADKVMEKKPVYDAKKLDALIGNIAREMRLLDVALKNTNATLNVKGYEQDDAVLGVIE